MNNLDIYVSEYGRCKKQLDEYKKLTDSYNASIKSLMSDMAISEYENGDYKVTKVIQTRETMNEDGIIAYAHEHLELLPILKTREYVDYDMLESLIYSGQIPEDLVAGLGKFKQTKEVETLRIKEVKK